jgi:ABC-type uncharacterized transport system involved in gliding motility auxiliary subunit
MVELRQQLRDVRAELRREVEDLEQQLRVANIMLVPAVIILIGLIVAFWRRARLAAYLRGQRTA